MALVKDKWGSWGNGSGRQVLSVYKYAYPMGCVHTLYLFYIYKFILTNPH
jgi:hypothetical protein